MDKAIATKLRISRQTSDYFRWADLANHKDGWADRTRQMTKLIAPDTRVFEFGAGRCHLRKMLPSGCSYTPSDLVSRGPQTFVCDLNQKTLPAFPAHDLAVFSGVLEYIHDIPRLIDALGNAFHQVLCSYATLDQTPEYDLRLAYGWFNAFTSVQLIETFEKGSFSLVHQETWRSQSIYLFHNTSFADQSVDHKPI